MKQWHILIRIRDYGGVLGAVAKLYLPDIEKGKGYICEIAEQCVKGYMNKIWDEKLIDDIKEFANQQKTIKS